MTAWLPAAAELDAYEGIRRGDEDAFRALAEPLQPTLRRLAGLYVGSEATTDAVVLHGWEIALHNSEMFCWHSPLATWIAAITVDGGRRNAPRAPAPAPDRVMPAAVAEKPGPADWSDLPWSARWEHAGRGLTAALAALPTAQREVVHGRDVERWPPRRVCDVFGLPEAVYERCLAEARIRLHAAVAQHVGTPGSSPHRDAQIAALTGWLSQRLDARPQPLDPRVLGVFRRCSAERHGSWQRLFGTLRHLSGSGGPAARRGGPGSAIAWDRPTPT